MQHKLTVTMPVQKSIDEIAIVVTDYWLNEKDDNEKDILFVENSVIGTLGNFSCVAGRAKSRKTFFISILCSSALSGENCGVTSALSPEKSVILYVDTEQSKKHYKRVMSRIRRMGNFDEGKLIIVPLREFNTKDRLYIIEQALERYKENLGLVIIDGIRDLVNDINSSSDANEMVTCLLRWTTLYNIHIVTVLHFNKNDDNARGHLGTEIINKAETVIQIEKDKEYPNRSIVSAQFIRGLDFEKFAFWIDDEGIPILDEEFDPQKKSVQKNDFYGYGEEIHRKVLSKIFSQKEVFSRSELKSLLKENYLLFGKNLGERIISQKDGLFSFLLNKQILVKENENNSRSGYKFNESFHW
jgi:hypothetical protein